jgi:hypothetical protein
MGIKIISVLLLTANISLASLAAEANNGPLDGIYNCNITVDGYTKQSYVTVNGYPDGNSVFAIPAISQFPNFYGYGQGRISGYKFDGMTSFGLPFYLNTNGFWISGVIGIILPSGPARASIYCEKIY